MNRQIDPLEQRNLHAAIAAENARERRRDRNLAIGYRAVLVGFLALGVVGLALGTPVVGIG